MKVIAVIQARLDSHRLPNKVLLQIPPNSGVSMLEHVVRKAMLAKLVDTVVVVTPDIELVKISNWLNVDCQVKNFLERDVLKEYYEAAKFYMELEDRGGIIVRLTADCPMVQPEIIDQCVEKFLESDVDLVYNSKGKYNDGTDVEVFSYESLEQAYKNANNEEREHVGLWMRKNLKTLFCRDKPLYEVESVDTYEDYLRVCHLMSIGAPQ